MNYILIKYLCFFFGVFLSNLLFCQNTDKIIETQKLLDISTSDTVRYKLFLDAAKQSLDREPYLSMKYLDSAELITQKTPMPNSYTWINSLRGQIEYRMTDYKKALEYYIKIDSALKTDYPVMKGFNYLQMSNVYSSLELYDNATLYITKSDSIFKSINHTEYDISIRINKALILSSQKKLNLSLDILNDLESKIIQPDDKLIVFNNIAQIHLDNKNFEKSLLYFLKSKQIADSINNQYALSIINNNIADLYMESGNITEWKNFSAKAIEQAKKIGNSKLLIDLYYNEYKYFKETGNLKDAIQMLESYSEVNKRFSTEKLQNEIQIITARNNYLIEKEKVAMAKLKNDAAESRMKYWIFSTILFAAFSIITLFFFFGRQRAYKKLLEKNKEVISESKPIVKTEFDDSSIELYNKFIELLDKKQIYLDPDLSLTSIAGQLGTGFNKLSKLINYFSGNNYSDLINQYRIKHAQKLLSDSKYSKYSIAGIAEMSGYKTRAAFNLSFKKITGLTPSYYQKNINN